MTTPDNERDSLLAEFRRLSTVEGVLSDIDGAAWESMERRDFADSVGEITKLNQIRSARRAVHEETSRARNRYLEHFYGKDGADELRAEVQAQLRTRGIRRSR
ncbi:hypothetical protein DFR70_103691 [Nocardia tenerifensis]|uniref:Uncharacterized protein n=1 Tax=Nocardia tenerifensis TaxID=228006 RepID=A0A318KAB8_9NOCA|nr:hypothetical protein [Nocardia tenerifensis]PXX66936.1 hypothetical protein DFR70_103691 [Nocardia tenerifensis]